MKKIKLPSGKTIEVAPEKWNKIPITGKSAWVKALKSGKYKKNQLGLRTNNSYCCLGVKRKLEGCKWERRHDDSTFIDVETNEEFSYKGTCGLSANGNLPFSVFYKTERGSCLVDLNDDLNLSFKDIAYIINIAFEEKKQ